jgi:hypothetical protein
MQSVTKDKLSQYCGHIRVTGEKRIKAKVAGVRIYLWKARAIVILKMVLSLIPGRGGWKYRTGYQKTEVRSELWLRKHDLSFLPSNT